MNPRQTLHQYLPSHFHDPVGLALRLIRSRDGAAWFAMASAALGFAASPLDKLLARLEPQAPPSDVPHAPPARHPLLFICGPPRSGTTVVYQALASHLPVAYFSNLTSLFPRAPLAATRWLGGLKRRPTADYRSFYGKTRGLGGTNDALYLWDRWLGPDRDHPRAVLDDGQRSAMQEFFAACEALFDKPLVNKNNNLMASAHLVAGALPQARFLCLERDAGELAKSLYRARTDIHGGAAAAYGLAGDAAAVTDPVEAVCRQVDYLSRVTDEQEKRLGANRFRRVKYEDFCRDPTSVICRVAKDLFGDAWRIVGAPPASFPIPRGDKVEAAVAAQIEARLAVAVA